MNAKNRTRAALALLTSVTVALAVGSAGAQTPPTGSKATYWPLDTTAIPVTNGCTDALPQIEAVLRKSPQDHEAWLQYGRCHGEAKVPPQALRRGAAAD